MTIAEWLVETMDKLGQAGADSPRRDALVLLEDVLQKDRAWVLAHPEYLFQGTTLEKVNALVERRMKREPLAYIRGRAWFYGRFFEVNPNVLIPRPESESFIDLLKQIVNSGQWTVDRNFMIVDIGTGSGALAITAKLELPDVKVIATDIDEEVIRVARNNAETHKVKIEFIKSDLLESLPSTIFQLPSAIVANLPYVPSELATSPEIEAEPKLALFSGKDGLDHYRKFWEQVAGLGFKPKYILTESLESQHKELQNLAKVANYKLHKTEILVQVYKLAS